MENKKSLKFLYGGSVILCGTVAGLWAFTANRFQVYESFGVVFGGMMAGVGLGMMCHGLVALLKR